MFCSCLLIYWSQIVKKKYPIAVKKRFENRKVFTENSFHNSFDNFLAQFFFEFDLLPVFFIL